MVALMEILIIAVIVIIIATLMGVVQQWWLASIFLLVLCALIIYMKKYAENETSKNNDEKLLDKQVKFYDFVFKAITVVLALSAVFLYKDRQDMKRNLEEEFKDYKLKFIAEAESLKTTSKDVYYQLEGMNKTAFQTKKDIEDILKACKNEYSRFVVLREDIENKSYSIENSKETRFNGLSLSYIKKDTLIKSYDVAFYNNLAADLGRVGNRKEAKKYLLIALEKNNRCKDVLWNLGYIYFVEDSLELAMQCANKIIEYYPENGVGYFVMAQCLLTKDKRDSKIYLQKAIDKGYRDYASVISLFCAVDTNFYKYIPKELK